MAQLLWSQKQNFGPTARYDHAMVFDTVRQQTLLFGGAGAPNQLLGDTWTWDGNVWRQVSDIGPSPRSRHGMAFDSIRGRAILFGGDGGANETWEWDGALWTELANTGPAASAGMALAFHLGLKQVVLFGGLSAGGVVGSTWAWNGALWTQIADDGPPPRQEATATYSQDAQTLVLVGGADANGAGLGDTWTFDGQQWTEVTDLQPGPTTSAAMADAAGGPLLFGGAAKSADPGAGFGPNAGTTWRFAQGKWTEVVDFGPPARWRHACAFDSMRGVVVLFGGSATLPQAAAAPPASPTALGDTWETQVGTFAAVAIAGVALSGPTLASTPGSTLSAVVTLTVSSPTPVDIDVEVVTDGANQQPVDPQSVSASQLVIPPGSTQGTIVITRGPAPLAAPGTLILGVELSGGGNPQGVPFQA